jgi:hypothetical protein
MSDITIKRIPTQVFIGAYQGEETASQIERMVTDEEWDSKSIICTNMALAKQDIAGKTRIREMGNPQAMEAAVSNAMLGGLLGSMSRLMIGSDAVAKAAKEVAAENNAKPQRRTSALAKVAVKQVQGMDKDRLQKLKSSLKPNTSAIVLIFDEVLVKASDYDAKMKGHHQDADAIVDIVTARIEEHLGKGNDIAFHITFEDGEITATRTIQGKDAMQVRDIVLGQDSLSVNQVTTSDSGTITTDKLVITPETVVRARTMLTSSLVAYEISAADDETFVFDAGYAHDTETSFSTGFESAVVTSDGGTHTSTDIRIEKKQLEN